MEVNELIFFSFHISAFRKKSISDANLEVDSFYNMVSNVFFSHSADPVKSSL